MPPLIVVSGLPGVGKTAVAAELAARSGDTWRRAAGRQRAPVIFVVLTCSDSGEHRRRLERRTRGFTRLPEPSWSRVLERSRDYAPWSGDRVEVDTLDATVSEVCDLICARIRSD